MKRLLRRIASALLLWWYLPTVGRSTLVDDDDIDTACRDVGERALEHRPLERAAREAPSGNARALGRMAGGRPISPTEWIRLAEDDLAARAALETLPMEMLRMVHRRVTANQRMLRS